MAQQTGKKVPVHVLTGFLGSGKTTLLNSILQNPAFANSAVIINEFGEIGLDHHLVETGEDTIIELSNGCLCCTVRGQLIDTIESLLKRNPERILIETTGLADPAPVLQALIASPVIGDDLVFSGLLTTLDVSNGISTMDRHSEASKQVALADKVILTKIDELTAKDVEKVLNKTMSALKLRNPAAQIVSKTAFLENLELYFSARDGLPNLPDVHDHFHHHHDINQHSEKIVATVLKTPTSISRQQLDMFLDLVLSAHSAHILRIKGLVQLAGEARPLVIQGVGNRLSEPYFLKKWPTENQTTQLVVFLEDMPAEFIQRLFRGFFNIPQIDTPDRNAMTDNPLSIAGFSPRK